MIRAGIGARQPLIGFGDGEHHIWGSEVNINAKDIEKHDGDHFAYERGPLLPGINPKILLTVIVTFLLTCLFMSQCG